jgi:hypothetical protein
MIRVLVFFLLALAAVCCGRSTPKTGSPPLLAPVATHLKVVGNDSNSFGDSTTYAVDQTFDDFLKALDPLLRGAGYKTVGIQTSGISRSIEFYGVDRNVFNLADNPNGMTSAGDSFQGTQLPPVSLIHLIVSDKS